MALIPPDAGIRLRLQTEASVLQPTAPVHEIPADLPELRPGQAFTARIQEVLPDNTYKALVAGRSLTLQLPEGARGGETLELVVIDRTPKVLIARLAEQKAETGTLGAYQFTTLSRTAQLIGQLLVREGESPAPAPLNGGQPLLSRPPAGGGELAPALMKAVGQSGLFYEAHQAQWINGKLPLAILLQEPQGRQSATELLATHQLEPPPREHAASRTVSPGLFQGAPGNEESTRTEATQAQVVSAAQSVPEEIRSLVQQQLEAAAGQPMLWRGEIWPGQVMDWRIEQEGPEERKNTDGPDDETELWRTTLSLTTPRLGRIEATLRLDSTGVRISLATTDDASALNLGDAIPALAAALAAAGVPLLAMQVKRESV